MNNLKYLARERLHGHAGPNAGDPPKARDWVLVAVLVLIATGEVVGTQFTDNKLGWWEVVRVAVAVVAVAPLPWRRVLPVPFVLVSSLAMLLGDVAIWTQGPKADALGSAGVGSMILFYSLYRWARTEEAVTATVALAGIFLADLLVTENSWAGIASVALVWPMFAGFAIAMRYRASLAEQRKNEARLLERHDLARELHDTVAHHVSAIAVQAQAAQFVSESNPAAASQAMRDVELLANKTIDEMRRMVGILRSDDSETRSVTAAGLSELASPDSLPAVNVSSDLDHHTLASPVSAALYRIAQESVTNARRHSRGVTSIDIAASDQGTHIELTITNDGVPTTRTSGSGYGQIGMQERVDALAGKFESGPQSGGGWRTTASIPKQRRS